MYKVEIEYIFDNNKDVALNDILISILNSKIRVVDFKKET